MKKTFREKVMFWGNRTVKKHSLLKVPVVICMMAVLGAYYACLSLVNNGKMLAFVCVAFLFFFVNSSFGFQDIVQATEVPLDEQGLQLATETINVEDIDLTDELDDSLLLEFFEEDEYLMTENADVFTNTLICNRLNFMAMEDLREPRKVQAKIRYAHKGAECLLERIGEDEIRCTFTEPVRAVTPGQAVVFYEGEYVLGGGTIC